MHFSSQFVIHLKHCGVESTDFCFRYFIFIFDPRMTLLDFFQRVFLYAGVGDIALVNNKSII